MISLFALLLAVQPAPADAQAAAAASAVAAERAFAARAQSEGQWTAFRATAAPDATMLAPGPVNAHDFLRQFERDPAVAVMWWPARVWVSCDGALAVTTGPWVRNGGTSVGSFTTVWRREADGGWRWVYDNGRELPAAIPAPDRPVVEPVFCGAQPGAGAADPTPPDIQFEGRALNDGREGWAALRLGEGVAGGRSADGSLSWTVSRVADAEPDAYQLSIFVRVRSGQRLALADLHGLAGAE